MQENYWFLMFFHALYNFFQLFFVHSFWIFVPKSAIAMFGYFVDLLVEKLMIARE